MQCSSNGVGFSLWGGIDHSLLATTFALPSWFGIAFHLGSDLQREARRGSPPPLQYYTLCWSRNTPTARQASLTPTDLF
eukprot:1162020-Pelagomonas_calceolata.AAC.24